MSFPRPLAVFLFLCLCIVSCGAMQIIEFCPDPYLADDADEYIVLSGHGSLDGIAISDNHGGFRFPDGTAIEGTLTVARNGLAFKETHGRFPDFEWQDYSPDVPDVISGAQLRLANTRDELMVYENSRLVQKIAWPGDVSPRQGQVHFLEAGVWDPRPLMLGQSRLSPTSFDNVTVTAFVSPDSSLEVFSGVIESAEHRVLVNVYELTSANITADLINAKKRGVDVEVLLEGGPVGGISPSEKSAIYRLNQSGIPVFEMAAPEGGHEPYRYDHAKYVVIDDRAVLVTSENFGHTGFPSTGETGNRGWGVVMEEPRLAAYFGDLYQTDISGSAITPVGGNEGPLENFSIISRQVAFEPATFTGARVTPVISPDTSDEITDLLVSAQESIEIQQAYITNESKTRLNPYLATAINASRRGVHVRVLLDSYWYNTEDEADNDEMVALINRIAASDNLPLEARCADLEASGLEKIHNKGVIVDDRAVLVSSINWNTNSPGFNREAGVIIEQPVVARYFRTVFDADWSPAVHSPHPPVDYLKIACVATVIGILMILYYRRHIR
ncbi:phospholipase D-like domain-containing protein [Methanoregula sp.]|uniref:phospholipase D-like domain-containing protein n=1 Tax=Methanoregula sp. TaxID=2052170 RepID=UPI003BB0244B